MALHPVGPLPASTYWRRRLVLALGLLVLLLVARSCVGGGAHPASRATPAATAAAPASPTAAAARTSAPATPSAPSARPSPAAVGTCPDSALRVVAKTDVADYPVGSSPKLTVTVTNASGADCRRDLGTAAVVLLVYSGTDRIWSSADCAGPAQREVLTLKAGASLEKTVPWYGKRSARGCPSPSQQPQALPGTYWAVAEVGGVRSAQAVFRFR